MNCRQIILAVLISFLNLFCVSCNNPAETTGSNVTAIEETTENFTSILHCSNYAYQDGYFFTPDYGCLYSPGSVNSFGNLAVYLIPLKSIDSSSWDAAAKQISSLSATDILKQFDAYVLLIPKRDLHYNATGDPAYYQKDAYTEKLFDFNRTTQQWKLVDSITIAGNFENEKTQLWRDKFLQGKVGR